MWHSLFPLTFRPMRQVTNRSFRYAPVTLSAPIQPRPDHSSEVLIHLILGPSLHHILYSHRHRQSQIHTVRLKKHYTCSSDYFHLRPSVLSLILSCRTILPPRTSCDFLHSPVFHFSFSSLIFFSGHMQYACNLANSCQLIRAQ